MSPPIFRSCQNFYHAIQGDSDWSGIPEFQRQSLELCNECIEWLTVEHKDHKRFTAVVDVFFCILRELYERKGLPEQEVRGLRDRALVQIGSFSQDGELSDYLKYNTYLGDSGSESSDSDEESF